MNDDKFDDEMHALLSAHAMGTLTAAERARLFEKAIGNQTIFDALMDEETSRAALESPHTKRALANALAKMDEQRQPRPRVNGWLLVAVACSVAVGVFSFAWLRMGAELEKPAVVAVAQRPPEAAPLAGANATQAAPPKKKAGSKAPKETLAERTDAVSAPAPAVAAQGRQEAKQPEAMPLAEATAARDSGTLALPRGRGPLAKAKERAPVLRVFNRQLILEPVATGFAYLFIVDGERIRPLLEAGANTLEAGQRRSIAIGDASATAELWVLLTPTVDPVLERALTGVLPLPTRDWVRFPIQ